METNEKMLKDQRKRLAKVFSFLKENGISQKYIADTIDVDEAYLSHLKSGKIKYIPKIFLEKLHQEFNINSGYIRLKSNFMIDITGTKLENFEKFVDSWDVIKKGNDKYLHFTMDKNFYDFLIDVDVARRATDDGVSSLEVEINNLKEMYSGEADSQEFVLIPRNNFIEIIKEAVEERKNFCEVIDLIEHSIYIDE